MKNSSEYKKELDLLLNDLVKAVQFYTKNDKINLPDQPVYNAEGGAINEVIVAVTSSDAIIENNAEKQFSVPLISLGSELLVEVLENLEAV